MEDFSETILSQYDRTVGLHTDFMNACQGLVKILLQKSNISVHETTARLKTRGSLTDKLNPSATESKYNKLSDITDIVGLRVITYFNDDVDKVADIIRSEFNVDYDNSSNKRDNLKVNQFGYLSQHFVASISAQRLGLAEYRSFKKCVFEIQIRTILQHAWAEVEHDLGYKSKDKPPEQFRRRFALLAASLERADDDFVQIRDGLALYRRNIPQEIVDTPELVLIDQVSLEEFVKIDPIVKEIDEAIVAKAGGDFPSTPKVMTSFLKVADDFDIRTIDALRTALVKYKDVLPFFAQEFMSTRRSYLRGISIFYLGYILAAKDTNGVGLDKYFELVKIRPFIVEDNLKQRVEQALEVAMASVQKK